MLREKRPNGCTKIAQKYFCECLILSSQIIEDLAKTRREIRSLQKQIFEIFF
jgi:hypothetical protein